MKALETDPAKRFQSAAEMKAALRIAPPQTPTPAPVGPASAAATSPTDLESPAENHDPSVEVLIMMALVAGIAGVIVGIVMIRSAWFALGLLAVEQLASAITWRRDSRAVVGTVLALGGIAASVVIGIYANANWWMILLIWFWYGERVRHFFSGLTSADFSSGFAKLFTEDWSGFTPDEQRILKAIHGTDGEGIVKYPTDLEGEELAKLRDKGQVRPDERVLAVVSLSDDESPESALIFGSRHAYFPAVQNAEPIRCSLAYESLPGRQIVNHGLGVFMGDGIIMTVEGEVNGESLVCLFTAIRQAMETPTQAKM